MPIYKSLLEMVDASLHENLLAARICLDTKSANGACLGFPCATLLMAIIDAMGSYTVRNNFSVLVDGVSVRIRDTSQHFYILNSHFFNLNLSAHELSTIYKVFRCRLVHNSAIPVGYELAVGEKTDAPFEIKATDAGSYLSSVHLEALLALCETAVEEYLKYFATLPSTNGYQRELASLKTTPNAPISKHDDSISGSIY
jgi:hypothetical protein